MKTDLPPLQGFKYLDRVSPLLSRLHGCGCERDRAGNRDLHFDRYAALLLLYFFNPAVTSLRGLAAATGLDKVAAATGGGRVSLGSLSEAPAAFDPDLLRGVLREVTARSLPAEPPADRAALRDLVAVDGTLLHALPRMAWAVWQGPTHRAAKVHVAFEVFRGTPADATVTAGTGSERRQLRAELLRPGRVYVVDRGYESYGLLADIRAAGSSFVARLQADADHAVAQTRPVGAAAAAAGVVRDVVLARLGQRGADRHAPGTVRLVTVAGAAGAGPVLLATDRLDWPAELVALAYRYRWSVELFFRWLKAILGCRHLLSQSSDGVALQVYAARIASVLLAQWTGRKPDKRTFEMFCHYFSGWATEAELQDYLQKRQTKTESSA
jgi:IS4 transposase